MKTSTLRKTAFAAAAGLAAGIALVAVATSASAVGARYTGTPIGTLSITPTAGGNQTAIDYQTSAGCPAGVSFETRLYGFGMPDLGEVVTSRTDAGFSSTSGFRGNFSNSPQFFADKNATTLQGTYDVVVRCSDRLGGPSRGDFLGRITFSSPTTYTVDGTVQPSATPTATMTPTPTATMTPTPSPTPTTTPTATPTPSASPTAFNPCTTPARVTLTRSTIIATGEAPLTVTAPASSTVELYAYSRPSTTYRLVRTGVTSATGTVGFAVKPPTNTRLYAIVRGCTPNTVRDSVVLNVRTAFSLFATRTGPRTYRFSGDSLPARPRGLIVSLYRVTASGSQVLTSQTRADGVDGTWEIDRTFTGSGRFGFVVRAGQDLQNAPGSSNVRPTLIF